MDTWIKVKDRLPELRKPYSDAPYKQSDAVLVFTGTYITSGKYAETYSAKHARWENSAGRLITVTHWMPFPPKPSTEVT